MYLGCSIKYEDETEGYLGVVKRAIDLNINTFMFYIGSAIGGKKPSFEEMRAAEAIELLNYKKFDMDKIVVHAPFNINLANTVKPYTYNSSIKNLINEIRCVNSLGIKLLVLHPGHHLGAGFNVAANNLIKGLNECLVETSDTNVIICLETMVGKASELGGSFEELSYIIDGIKPEFKDRIGICLDTCHIYDHGYSLNDTDSLLREFDKVIGLENLCVIHLNDTKSSREMSLKRKDRHECIGCGFIGFDQLSTLLHNEKLKNIPFILETPRLDEGYESRRKELEMLKDNKYDEGWDFEFRTTK